MSERYRLLTIDGFVESEDPGLYAGNTTHKIFGTLTCRSGRRMKKENRVFFRSLDDAIRCGYRPCQNCKPLHWEAFEESRKRLGMGLWNRQKPKDAS